MISDDQLLRITARDTDVETLRASHARLREIVEEQTKLLDEARQERDEAREAMNAYIKSPGMFTFSCNCDVCCRFREKYPWLEEGKRCPTNE